MNQNKQTLALLLITIGFSISSLVVGKVNKSHKVIVVNARGANLSDIEKYSGDQINFPFLNSMSQTKNLRPLKAVENAVTAVNLASFDTGLLPSKHGIIGHTFGLKNTEFEQGSSGFGVRFEQEAFWETAARLGKKVLYLGALVTHGKHNQHQHVDIYAQASKVAPAQLIDTNNPIFNQTISLNSDIDINIKRNQNKLFITANALPKTVEIDPNQWGELTVITNTSNPAQNLIFKWIHNNTTSKLYIRDLFKSRTNTVELADYVKSEIGENPGWPNINAYIKQEIDSQTLIEEIVLEATHVMSAFNVLTQKKSYDLITIDYPVLDRFGHAFVNANFDKKAYAKAYQLFDNHMGKINDFAKEHDYELIIASGHGFTAVNTEINLNAFLKTKGFSVENQWQVRAFPGKVSSHININPNIPELQQKSLLKELQHELMQLKEQKTNEPVIEKIYQKDELHEIGLNHKNAGDLFVQLKPGYLFQAQMFSDRPIFDIPSVKGDHGYSTKHEASRGMIYSIDMTIGHIIEIAPYIKKQLLTPLSSGKK